MDKCPLCSNYFHPNQIVDHIINCEHWYNGKPDDPVCFLCKKSVPDINQHFISHHSRPHKCVICNVRFFRRINLKKHLKRHLRISKAQQRL